jgi:uncharacterized protein
MEQQSVLITGGSGLIGTWLTLLLSDKGYRVSHLSRSPSAGGKIKTFTWDPQKGVIDRKAFEGIDCIINLAGANIGEARWTEARKRKILDSRIKGTALLYQYVREGNIPLKAFISSSASGYYGSVTVDRIFTENDPPASDFLGKVCQEWESEAAMFASAGIRTVIVRSGVVLEKSDGALARFLAAGRFGIFPVIGSGEQYIPWIHIKDLCGIYLKALTDSSMSGPYNAVAPSFTNNREFMRILAGVMKKAFLHPSVPAVFLKAALGESSVIATEGSRISSEKISACGYHFLHTDLREALNDVLR